MDIIKVKIMSDGEPKGRAYTYRSDIDVKVGDIVTADMGGSDKTLVVTEIGIPQAEIEGLDYEIKSIHDLADLTEPQEPAIAFKVLEESLPVVKINYEEMKAALQGALEKYSGLVVTKQTLSGCKATQKELAGVRNKIDAFRKDKKKELSKPITDFESQCKELIALVEQVEKPIKDGINVFDDETRSAKREAAEKIMLEVVTETGLNEKYAKKLTVIDKYCNLTAKPGEVRTDLEQRAFALKVEQGKEAELLDIIKDCIDSENKKINAKMSIEDFYRSINIGMATKDIIADVRQRAQRIYDAENPPVKQEEPIPVPEPEAKAAPVVETPPVEPQIEEADPECFGVYRITAPLTVLRGVSGYLKANNIAYTVLEQGEL